MSESNAAKFKISPLYGWPVLLLGLLITAMVSFNVHDNAEKEDNLRFDYEIDRAIKRIQFRMERYEGFLVQTRAFFLASKDVSREEFHTYYVKTRLRERYPGIQGLGFALRINPKNLAAHIKKTQKEIPTYSIWPDYKRNDYFSIFYLEPMDERNKDAIGFDMFTESTRQEAMRRARDSGIPTMSGKITLVQENGVDTQPGFNLYVPLYHDGQALETVEQRRKQLIGFVYSPFRTRDLFASIFLDSLNDIDVEIFDGKKISNETLLYDHDGYPFYKHEGDKNLSDVKQIEIAGRTLTLNFTPSKSFKHKSTTSMPVITGITGILISLLLFWIVWITKREAITSQNSEIALKEAVLARDEFLSIASHELKTPLTSIKLQAQMIKRSVQKDDPMINSKEKLLTLVEQTDRQTLRLARLVDDMLDISRIRTGRLTIEKEELDFSELVSDVITRMKEQFQEIPGGEPILRLTPNTKGKWDRTRMEQVISNLLTNAVKYGNKKEIIVEVSSTAESVTLKVTDHGIGVKESFKEKIFERFERAGISPNEVSGLGLGLYITKQIVLSHGGEIKVESETNKGSTFIVTLPRYGTRSESRS